MLNPGEKSTLSRLRENDCGILNGVRFIVVARDPEDRSSGVTTVRYQNHAKEDFIWDTDDPIITYIGKGSIETKIIFPIG